MGGYIFFRSSGGLCDSLCTLQRLIPYAKKYDRTIILDLVLYSASDVEEILDFSDYPIKIICKKNAINGIKYDNVEPSCFKPNILRYVVFKSPGIYMIDGQVSIFDLNKEYPISTLLIYYTNIGGEVELTYLKFSKSLINEYYAKMSLLPKNFDAVHLRATDHFNQKVEEDLNAVRKFVKDKPNVYLATDNMKLMELLSEEFPQIIKSFAYKNNYKLKHSLHHDYGNIDADLLKSAILDILICSSSEEFLPSVGGFSRLIRNIHNNKHILKRLTSTAELIRPDE
jgi:hypothetical protein